MIAEGILNRLAVRLDRALAPPAYRIVPWIVDGYAAGLLDEERLRRIARFERVFKTTADSLRFVPSVDTPARRTEALEAVVRTLHDEGRLTRWRDESYAVARTVDAPALFQIERAAARYFGIATHAAHVNATTSDASGLVRMWIARRSASKPVDPGLLDNLVGGGVAAGATVTETMIREAREEAGIERAIAERASPAGTVRIFRAQPDGLHRETIHVHDLALSPDFVPRNDDGEVAEFRLAAVEAVSEWAGNATGVDVMTADAALVFADWLIRHDAVPRESPSRPRLEALRKPAPGIPAL